MTQGFLLAPVVAFAALLACDVSIEAADTGAAADAVKFKVTVVTVNGGGWGAEAKVRAAIEKQEGIKRVLLGGLCGTVIMEEGKSLDEAAVRKAVEAAQLSFVSLESVERLRPKAVYRVESEGLGWAVTHDKARVALEKLDGIADVYIDSKAGITLAMTREKAPDASALGELLAPHKIKVVKITRWNEPLYDWNGNDLRVFDRAVSSGGTHCQPFSGLCRSARFRPGTLLTLPMK